MAFLWRAKGTQFFDNSGNPLNGGKLAYFDAGTTSAKTVYQDSDEQTAWGSIVLDSSGRLEYSVYIGSGAFKERLRTSADVDIYTEDDIPGETVLTTSSFAKPNMPVLSKSLSYTVLQDDIGSMIQADPTGGDVTITLISAVTAGDGAQVGVQHVGSAGKVIVAVPGGQTVNGASTVTIRVPRAGAVFTSNAGVWSGPISAAPFATLSKTTTYTVGVVDHGKTIKADATGGAFTITLPAATDAGDGFEITVVKTDSSANAVTIDGDSAETVNGAANFAIGYQYKSATFRCDGSNWQVKNEALIVPTGLTDNTLVRADGTAGKLQSSIVVVDDSGNLSGVNNLMPPGGIFGLLLTNNGSDANNDIDVSAGRAASADSSPSDMVLASSITKRLDASWAVGSGNGGIDTGSKANSTTYHVWLIKRPDTGVVDALFSTSASSPTMPTNYTLKRRIGAVLTDGSGNIRAFRQNGDWFVWSTPVTDYNSTQTTTASSRALTLPGGISVLAKFHFLVSASSSAAVLFTSPLDTDIEPLSATSSDITSTYVTHNKVDISGADSNVEFPGVGWAEIWTSTSRQVRCRASDATINLRIQTNGWMDTRGRFA